MQNEESRTEIALYWSAVSLIVCEGFSIEKAARKLGLAGSELREILKRRTLVLLGPAVARHRSDAQPTEPSRPPRIAHDYPPTRPISMS